MSGIDHCALTDAYGRVAADTVHAPLHLPPFPASAMDGYAVRSTDFLAEPQRVFTCVGESRAGHPFIATQGPLQAGTCVRIFTGAPVPEGADQVLLQESVAQVEGSAVKFEPHTPAETYVRPIGHDIAAGQVLLERGEVLDSFCLGTLAAAGVDRLSVYALPRVGVFSTGDELVDPGTPPAQLAAGQIYDSNRFTVLNLLRACPCETVDLGRLPDQADAVHAALDAASRRCDVLITSGGVSVGDADFITATIEQLGQLEFWRLNLKPGKPMAFGRIRDCHVFGLPGNPVSTIVTLLLLAKPAIQHLAGAAHAHPRRLVAHLSDSLHHTPGRTEFQRGRATFSSKGIEVAVTGDQSSNRLQTFRGANCLIEVPAESGDLNAGARVSILWLTDLLV